MFRLADPVLSLPHGFWLLSLLVVSFLQHLLNLRFIESEMITALMHHPGEGYIGYVIWYVVFIASSYVRMDAREPTLLETSAPFGVMLTWEVPECGRE